MASTNATESTTKQRGRPPKPKNEATEPAAEPTTAPTKRGRGRPRKAEATKAPVSRKQRNRSPQDAAKNHGSLKRRRVSKTKKPSSDLDLTNAAGSEDENDDEEEEGEVKEEEREVKEEESDAEAPQHSEDDGSKDTPRQSVDDNEDGPSKRRPSNSQQRSAAVPHLVQLAGLTAEQARHLDPPRQLVKQTKTWTNAKSVKSARFYLDPQLRSSVDYDMDWTVDQEHELWSRWTKEDQRTLEAVLSSERTAWAKAMRNYQIPAPDILQDPLFVWTNREPLTVDLSKRGGQRVALEQINWGEGFSRLFVKILCCVAFADDLAFLRYTLQYALFLRLGANICPKPSKSILFAEGDGDWLDVINEKAQKENHEQVPEEFRELINIACRKKNVKKDHPHMSLIFDLKRQVKKDSKSEFKGLCNADITNIRRAWDLQYILRPEHKGSLKTTDEYHSAYEAKGNTHKGRWSEGQTMSRLEEVLCWKREWIMGCRRRLERERGKQPGSDSHNIEESGVASSNHQDDEPMLILDDDSRGLARLNSLT
jgi:hypothetical protein